MSKLVEDYYKYLQGLEDSNLKPIQHNFKELCIVYGVNKVEDRYHAVAILQKIFLDYLESAMTSYMFMMRTSNLDYLNNAVVCVTERAENIANLKRLIHIFNRPLPT